MSLRTMSRNQWLLLVTAFLSVYGIGQIWLVQLSSYHLWAFVGAREFSAYHWAWWQSIWFVVMVPTGVVFLGSTAMLWMPPEGVPAGAVRLGFTIEALIALGTLIWWGPLMARLANPETGLILPRYHQLMLTHWVRVVLVTLYGILAFWMLLRSVMTDRTPTEG